jgi:hypothetical protein
VESNDIFSSDQPNMKSYTGKKLYAFEVVCMQRVVPSYLKTAVCISYLLVFVLSLISFFFLYPTPHSLPSFLKVAVLH